MNDDEVLAAARASLANSRELLDQVHMELPLPALVAGPPAPPRSWLLSW